MIRKADVGVAVLVMLAAVVSLFNRFPLDLVVLLAVTYATLRVSPSRVLTGKPSLLDDAMVAIGMLLLKQSFVPETYGGIATFVGGVSLLAFSIVVVVSHKVKKQSILGRFSKRKQWQRFVRVFVLTWALYVLLYSPIVTWLTELPVVTMVLCLLVLNPKYFPQVPHKLFHTKRDFLLGLAGILVLHAFFDGLVALTHIGYQKTAHWSLAMIGVVCLIALPAYMWYKTFMVRESHVHLPDWKPWQTALLSSLLVLPIFWPVVKLAPGIALKPFIQIPSNMPLFVVVAVFVVWYIIAASDKYLNNVLMAGPFLVGAVYLGMYVYYAFVTGFNKLLVLDSLFVIPFAVLIFVVLAFGLVLGYFSFLYELWRE